LLSQEGREYEPAEKLECVAGEMIHDPASSARLLQNEVQAHKHFVGIAEGLL